MADEKLNTGQEENSQPSLFDAGPAGAPAQNAPEQAAGNAPAQDAPAGAPGEVNVSADQIEKLMAERRARNVRRWKRMSRPNRNSRPPRPRRIRPPRKRGPPKRARPPGMH